jgi:1-deoxy-D-xylulose-5-phosphate reductoisomerase
MKELAILGSTGSVGRQTVAVLCRYPQRFKATLLAAQRDFQTMEEQIRLLVPQVAYLGDESAARELAARVGDLPVKIISGQEALGEALCQTAPDTVVAAMVGHAGLLPVVTAMEAGCNIALANKEALVMAGQLIMSLREKMGVQLMPMDSEHSAIFQCLQGRTPEEVRSIILTASGGPFRGKGLKDLIGITPAQAVNHPNWSMGAKISVDSATLMNKGLEVIEARWLFSVPASKIQVLVHPQSIVHSMVELTDGALIGHLGIPSMELPIQYALSWPERLPASTDRYLDWRQMSALTFEEPDLKTFPALGLAYYALDLGGTAPAVLSVANDYCVEAFLTGKISFLAIPEIVGQVLSSLPVLPLDSFETLLAATGEARQRTLEAIKVRGD